MITVLSKLAYLVQLEQVVAVEDCYPHVAYLGLGQDIDHKSHLPGVRKHKGERDLVLVLFPLCSTNTSSCYFLMVHIPAKWFLAFQSQWSLVQLPLRYRVHRCQQFGGVVIPAI